MLGQVISIDNEYQGGKIKVRVKGTNKIIDSYPYLPMPFRSTPKEGEMVVLISEMEGNTTGTVYYLGPFISLPQNYEYSSSDDAFGSSNSNLSDSVQPTFPAISNNKATEGAFPQGSDVAMIGRSSEDIILKEGEIDIRCGIRVALSNNDQFGNAKVAFNHEDPAFIQMKYEKNAYTNNFDSEDKGDFASVINLVSNKINLMSNIETLVEKDGEEKDNGDNYDLLTQQDLAKLMSDKLHPAVKGDELVNVLKILVDCFLNHYHHWFGPKEGKLNEQSSENDTKAKIDQLKKWRSGNFTNILSRDVRLT